MKIGNPIEKGRIEMVKRFVSLVLAVCMLMAMTICAGAEEVSDRTILQNE